MGAARIAEASLACHVGCGGRPLGVWLTMSETTAKVLTPLPKNRRSLGKVSLVYMVQV